MFVLDLRNDLATGETTANAIQTRAQGAYLGLAIGDALGATVEFMTPAEIRARHGIHRDLIGGGWLRLRRGQVTDDTGMSLALGRALLARGRVEAGAIAEAFSGWMRTKPVDIGHTVRRGIARYRRTGATEVPENTYDAGNGACMRTLPVALFTLGAETEDVAAACRTQAHVTHHNPLSDAATLTVVRMVQSAILGATREHLRELADALVAEDARFAFDRGRAENPGGYIVETMRAVLQALFATDGLETALIDVVNRGGDADTTGAILGMIVGALHGPEAIPRRWFDGLERTSARACLVQAQALVNASTLCRGRAQPR
ncbi:ADP-ribosyl-[dinitrogen reductase] hydrolase [Marichromatium bheemlicum]|uniref:ADP-ribosyl-[dinitrogen reductase] hydrolase n=1 Tax=Marichromatium bheemlicum TaxID=365339 RepID=A0ABX1I8T0_9GAMM|nr:ADP-ribosyl-[dinitrogen reductase] hydrolase [Marichromatium bheemlicum]NKN32610.1 ADP-ribosyl-[dinitrogen reductase] hydrolase [Marichromatium bheemlicum]